MDINTTVNRTANTNNTTYIGWITNTVGNAFNRALRIFNPERIISIDSKDYLEAIENIKQKSIGLVENQHRISDLAFENYAERNIAFNNMIRAYVIPEMQQSLLNDITRVFEERDERINPLFAWDNFKERIFIKEYEELTELPSDIEYDASLNECPISLDKLKKGDTVYCEKQLYSYSALKNVCTMGNGLVPHSRSVISWDKNVYKLSKHGED